MCIIVVKKSGQPIPEKSILKNCFINNPDGAGFMYIDHGHVHIKKGYMSFKKLYKALEEVYSTIDTTNVPIIYHFRIGTSGGNIPENTHPYALKKDIRAFKKLDSIVDAGVVHNGVISKYTPSANNKHRLNDTQLYIYKKMYKYAGHFTDKVKKKILKETSSKFAILKADGTVETIGSFIEEDGLLFSNYSFLNYNQLYNSYSNFWSMNDASDPKGQYYSSQYSLGDIYFQTLEEFEEALYQSYIIPAGQTLQCIDYTVTAPNGYSYLIYDGILYYINYDAMCFEYVSDYFIETDNDNELLEVM